MLFILGGLVYLHTRQDVKSIQEALNKLKQQVEVESYLGTQANSYFACKDLKEIEDSVTQMNLSFITFSGSVLSELQEVRGGKKPGSQDLEQFQMLLEKIEALNTSYYFDLLQLRDLQKIQYQETKNSTEILQDSVSELNSTLLQELKSCISIKCKQCPANWDTFGEMCYFFSNKKDTWHHAEANCVSQDSHLVTLTSEEELLFLLQNIDTDYWIGLSDVEVEGVMKWVDGTPYDPTLPFMYWEEGQPDNFEENGISENCVHFADYYGTKWNDNFCAYFMQWICKKSPS
nr:PREDICTED: CD209 antigen-like protein E isoform X3 [Latimeria chalumnae]XP_014345007.1 PREDICTED: CD209 antigen-like protein E isoform X3 [Latimeria chalumnae]|eukprot:XP_014345001.1 PREDICTED: CD209 antigen-like protein E isoform X3 [Latimeria chalumnae]